MIQHRPHTPPLALIGSIVAGFRRPAPIGPRRDETIHVGRMPRTDTFRIGIEVRPRPRDDEPEPRRGA